jgi:hypothetical protein
MLKTECISCTGTAPSLSDEERSAIHLLTAQGIPIGVLAPADPRFHEGEFSFDGQHSCVPNCTILRKFRPRCAVIMQTGLGLDVIDVDPRNGGTATFARLSDKVGEVLAHVETPGDGFHLYVPSSGHRSVSFGGIDFLAKGKCVYLPGTQRPKYAGKGYRWITPPRKAIGVPNSTFAEALAALIPASVRTSVPRNDLNGSTCTTDEVYGATGLLAVSFRTAAKACKGMRNRTCYSVAVAFAKRVGPDASALGRLHQVLLAASKANGLMREDGASRVGSTITSGIRDGLAMRQVL